jgi:hypothetical protein
MAFYFATDTVVLYSWTGAAWVIVGSGTGGGPSGPEWNANDAWMASFQLHPDGVTFTGAYNAAGSGSMRAGTSHAAGSGKFYFEFVNGGTASNNSPCIGVGSASADLTFLAGHDANAWTIFMNGTPYHNNSFGTANTVYAIGDIAGIAVDFTAATGSVKFYANNVLQANNFTSLTLGTMFPMAGVSVVTGSVQGKGTLRLKAAEQTYSPPAGYSSWS